MTPIMGDRLSLAELDLELRIALLPPISLSARFAGPRLYARRLVKLWKVDDGASVPLAESFRLLSSKAIAGVILRTLATKDYAGDQRYWTFPPLADLLPELRDLSWQEMLVGTVQVEAIKGVRGKRHRTLLPAELPRLSPDWTLSRLTLDGRDEFIAVQVRRAPAEPVKDTWRARPSRADIQAAMETTAQTYPPGATPSFQDIWNALKERLACPDLPRQVARDALRDYAPQLRGQRGRRSTKSPG